MNETLHQICTRVFQRHLRSGPFTAQPGERYVDADIVFAALREVFAALASPAPTSDMTDCPAPQPVADSAPLYTPDKKLRALADRVRGVARDIDPDDLYMTGMPARSQCAELHAVYRELLGLIQTAPTDAQIEQRARELFNEYNKNSNSAPWERQWEPTKHYYRQRALFGYVPPTPASDMTDCPAPHFKHDPCHNCEPIEPPTAAEEYRAATPEEEATIDEAAGLVKITLRFPKAMMDAIDEGAAESGLVRAAMIRSLVDFAIQQQPDAAKPAAAKCDCGANYHAPVIVHSSKCALRSTAKPIAQPVGEVDEALFQNTAAEHGEAQDDGGWYFDADAFDAFCTALTAARLPAGAKQS